MANELNFYGDPATDSGLTIVARIYDSAGAQVNSDVPCSEVGSLAIYVGSMPSAPAGQYGVRFFAGSEVSPRATGVIDWDGTQEVEPGPDETSSATEPYPALVRFRGNQRHVLRGLSFDAERRAFMLDLEEGETKTVSLNFNDILADSESISSVIATESAGVNVAVALNGNIAKVTLSGSGQCGSAELTVTKSGGGVFKVYMETESVINRRRDRHYYRGYA
ncbi:MAG: hypothetical protein MK185_17670 [Saccharospirillaceae bacterium]|nr:hypothetical protein [Saccharospirillaceae bacterium]